MAGNLINLRAPVGGAWIGRGFGRHYLWFYVCAQGHNVRVRCSAWRGRQPEPATGAIVCAQCERGPAPVPTQAEFLASLY